MFGHDPWGRRRENGPFRPEHGAIEGGDIDAYDSYRDVVRHRDLLVSVPNDTFILNRELVRYNPRQSNAFYGSSQNGLPTMFGYPAGDREW